MSEDEAPSYLDIVENHQEEQKIPSGLRAMPQAAAYYTEQKPRQSQEAVKKPMKILNDSGKIRVDLEDGASGLPSSAFDAQTKSQESLILSDDYSGLPKKKVIKKKKKVPGKIRTEATAVQDPRTSGPVIHGLKEAKDAQATASRSSTEKK